MSGPGTTANSFLGNDGMSASGFSDNLDDVRICVSLLTVSEIDGIRLAALVPELPSVLLLGVCGMGLVLRRKR